MLARSSWLLTKLTALCIAIGVVALGSTRAEAQFIFPRTIGGVQVNADGVLTGEMARLPQDIKLQLSTGLKAVDQDIQTAGLRMVSLKGLNKALQTALDNGTTVPADVQ